MLNRYARAWLARVLTPLAVFLLRRGVSPDTVTVVGTVGVVVSALVAYPQGQLFWGTIAITFFVFSDALDGTMARLSDRSSAWGGFLDSTLDRFGDAAVFGGLVLYATGVGVGTPWARTLAVLALLNLALGFLVSYARARAEAAGARADVGVAERSERLVATLVVTAFVGLGLPHQVLVVVLALLAVASSITLGQRFSLVRRQLQPGDEPARARS
ncbi:CDP-diacylglycerol--glycerol-3-phosphate 3-phosphatidyltransferase [Quadrisphaera granulorum]|uniref:Phosphatidylinositol phosphate synthase n=1 Tax=Quadrisphaera granulorum TaxID=317664 RepID=A0A316ATL5_9ACTN|nr:CDP-alcohol phosphatidyltransferase family protein [Quadrisphaera granulorum]PWJ53517.1 CDP-diacylglycerol--glycerol-3-phosphate 3-phosphatidyltransferase [Quadrisphaera granulorum]SZE96859.1 CDP-diacylglycerol--glycerol-3-phosphate 3-phosphatidyltransferase [Quadrisphaera granulorum]